MVFAANTDRTNQGMDPDRSELVVRGTLNITGAPDSTVVFRCIDPVAGNWHGIWLAASGDLAVTGPAEINDAVIGLAVPDPNNAAYPGALRSDITFNNYRDSDLVLMAAPGEKTSWSGNRDIGTTFYVAPAGTLQIAAGTTLDVTPGEDIEIRADGLILANGTDSQPITLTSSGASGSWNGIRFRDSPDTSVSRLDYVDFERPTYAVTVDSLSGNLFHCGFDPASAGDIYVPQDTRVPKGWEWNLDAGTRVVAKADEDERNAQWGEDPDRVEIQINGNVTTSGTQGNPVVFTSTGAVGEFSGDDWAGLTRTGSGEAQRGWRSGDEPRRPTPAAERGAQRLYSAALRERSSAHAPR